MHGRRKLPIAGRDRRRGRLRSSHQQGAEDDGRTIEETVEYHDTVCGALGYPRSD